MQLRTASGKSKSTTQKLVMKNNLFGTALVRIRKKIEKKAFQLFEELVRKGKIPFLAGIWLELLYRKTPFLVGLWLNMDKIEIIALFG